MGIDNVTDTARRVQYSASAGQTVFPYPFAIFDEDDLVVEVDGETQTITTDYTVSGVEEDAGGNVTFTSGLSSGDIVTIYSDTTIARTSDFQQNGPNLSTVMNDELDRITVVQQELREAIRRSIRFPMSSELASADIELSPISGWLERYLYINSAGELEAAANLTTTTLTQSVIGSLLYPQTAAELAAGVTPTNYFYKPGDVLRYGASTAASAAANVTAINAAFSSNKYVWMDFPGTYAINDSLTPDDDTTFEIGNGVTIQPSAWLQTGVVDVGIIDIDGKTNVTVKGGTLDGNKAALPTSRIFGVRVYESSRVTLIAVSCINMPGSNSAGTLAGDGVAVYGNGSADFTMIGCLMAANVRQGLSLVEVTRAVIQGCIFRGTTGTNPGAGIDIEGDDVANPLRQITITGCLFEDNQVGVVVTSYASDVSVTGNVFHSNRAREIHVAPASRVAITGNVIRAGGTVDGSPIVHIQGATDVIVANNTINGADVNTERQGILVESSTNVKVDGNEVVGTYGAGIQIGTTSMTANIDNAQVTNNHLINCVHAAVATTAPLTVFGNSGSGFYPLRLVMTGNVLRDSRDSGNEADYAIEIAAAIPAATQSAYRVNDNPVYGATGVFPPFPSGIEPPLRGRITWNPADLADGAGETSSDITVTGAALGDAVVVYPPYDLQGLLCSGWVSATDTAKIRIQHETGGANVNLASGVWRVKVLKAYE